MKKLKIALECDPQKSFQCAQMWTLSPLEFGLANLQLPQVWSGQPKDDTSLVWPT